MLDNELSAGDIRKLEAHITTCAACRFEFDSLRDTVELLNEVKFSTGGKFLAVMAAGMRPPPLRRSMLPRFVWVAAAACLATALVALYPRHLADPYSVVSPPARAVPVTPVRQASGAVPVAVPPAVAAAAVPRQQMPAVARGRAYLLGCQNPDGSWSSGNYPSSVAITALAVLSLLEQEQPDSAAGRWGYAGAVDNAAAFLLRAARDSGLVCGQSEESIAMYAHCYGMLALSRLYALTGREDIRAALAKAVQLSASCQSSRGGWRYQPSSQDDDILVTATQVLALLSAREAGVPCAQETLRNGVLYVKSCAADNGGFRYQPVTLPDDPAPSFVRTAAGVAVLHAAAMEEDRAARDGLACLATMPLRDQGDDPFFYYGLYFCSYLEPVHQRMREQLRDLCGLLPAAQNSDGSWSNPLGAVYATAVSTLFLQRQAEHGTGRAAGAGQNCRSTDWCAVVMEPHFL